MPKGDFQRHPALGRSKAGLRKIWILVLKAKMLSEGNQYKVKARITFQTTWSEQILHKPSLFFGKMRLLNFQKPAFPKCKPALGQPKADNRKMTFF